MICLGDVVTYSGEQGSISFIVVGSPRKLSDPVLLVPMSHTARPGIVSIELTFVKRRGKETTTKEATLLFDVVEESFPASLVHEWIGSSEFPRFSLSEWRVSESDCPCLLEAARTSGLPEDLRKLLL